MEVTGWWIGSGGYIIRPLSGGVPEDCISAVIVPLYKGKRERNECDNYR